MAHPEDLAKRLLELTDAQDWPGREALLTPDCEVVTPGAVLEGRAATTAYSRPLVSAFSDARHEIDVLAAIGDLVVVEGAWLGTHTAPLVTPAGEVPPTGRELRLPFAATVRVAGDLVASWHLYYDQLAFMAQLGLVPEPQAV